jgi:hypothetical protein
MKYSDGFCFSDNRTAHFAAAQAPAPLAPPNLTNPETLLHALLG